MYKQRKKRTEDRQEQMNREIAENIKTILDDYQRSILKIIQKDEDKAAAENRAIHAQIVNNQNNLTALTEGILSIQGRQFKEECRALLENDHEITLKEFEHITNEHRIYNALHGNHDGDDLYNLVEIKYRANLK